MRNEIHYQFLSLYRSQLYNMPSAIGLINDFRGDMQTWFLSCPVEALLIQVGKRKKGEKKRCLQQAEALSCAFSFSFATSITVFGKWQ